MNQKKNLSKTFLIPICPMPDCKSNDIHEIPEVASSVSADDKHPTASLSKKYQCTDCGHKWQITKAHDE